MREDEDDALWSGRAGLPPDLAALEHALGQLPTPPEPAWRPPARRPARVRWTAFALAAAFALVAGLAWWRSGTDAWNVETLAGRPRLVALPFARGLGVGSTLVTDAASRARVEVGGIGTVELEPGGRLARVRGRGSEHRLSLQLGVLHANIVAPPRQFVVETPGAVATDLGCAYTLRVGADGRGSLSVESGWVAFTHGGRESRVPAGASCPTWTGAGPGTPRNDEAPETFRAALDAFDDPATAAGPRSAALERALGEAQAPDAFTLWHLLARTQGAERARVAERLATFVPPPVGAPRERVLALDRASLDAWWNELGLGDAGWWRMWEDDWTPGR